MGKETEKGHGFDDPAARAAFERALSNRRDTHAMEEVKRQAPEWIEVIPLGAIVGRDGRAFTVEDANEIIARTQQLDMMLPIDFDHATDFAPRGSEVPAAGWITELEQRHGAIWGKVEWSDTGRAAVESLEYRYLSPVITLDDNKEKNVLEIIRAALTNNPNLKMRAILAREAHAELGGNVPFEPDDDAPDNGAGTGINDDDDDDGSDDEIEAHCHEMMDAGRCGGAAYAQCHAALCRFMRCKFANAADRKAAWSDLREHITRNGGRLRKKHDQAEPPAEMARKHSRELRAGSGITMRAGRGGDAEIAFGENTRDASSTIHREREHGVVSVARHLGPSPLDNIGRGDYPVHFKGLRRLF